MMNKPTRTMAAGLVWLSSLLMLSCGGGSHPGAAPSSGTTPVTPASNVVSVVVDAGPSSATSPTINTLYTTVTICAPGSTTACQTIDHIQVDTESYGLRVLAPVLTVTLPVTTASDGNSLVECTQFVSAYSWGPIATADVHVAGETASSVPIQVIGDANFTVVPADCSSTGVANDTVATFGANGILGIGVFAQDCGSACVGNAANADYYSCTQAGCTGIGAPLTSQVMNPVPLFATDNNGTIIELPSVANPGAATLTGSLIFGIDTQSNNASGTQTVLALDVNGNIPSFSMVFNGVPLSQGFIDAGSNGIFFNDASLTVCTNPEVSNFYCPANTTNLSATLTGVNNVTATVDFSIANALTILTNDPTYTAVPQLGGTYSSSSSSFDWGLPFFFGRRVANAIQGATTAVGTGPYVAF